SSALDFDSRSGVSERVKGHPGLTFSERTPPMNTPETPSLHRFDAYRLALDFRRIVLTWLPLKRTELSDQLDRASLSVPLNIAEGAGRSGRDQARHYAIARGSAFECLAVLDLLELEIAPPSSREARGVLLRVMAILTALV